MEFLTTSGTVEPCFDVQKLQKAFVHADSGGVNVLLKMDKKKTTN